MHSRCCAREHGLRKRLAVAFWNPCYFRLRLFHFIKPEPPAATGNKILDAMLVALAAFVVTWLVAFAVRLFNAPATLYRAEHEKAEQLEKAKKSKAEKQAAVDDLSEELSWAIHNLLNRKPMPANDEQTDAWEADCKAWCNKISEKLSSREFFTLSEQLHFDRLGVVPMQTFSVINNRYNHLVSQLSLKFDRLRDVIAWGQQRAQQI